MGSLVSSRRSLPACCPRGDHHSSLLGLVASLLSLAGPSLMLPHWIFVMSSSSLIFVSSVLSWTLSLAQSALWRPPDQG